MKTLKWKDVDIKTLALTKPEKIDKKHVSEIFLLKEQEKSDFVIQTPSSLVFSDGELVFSLSSKGEFYSFMEKIKSRVCEILHQNSSNFFKKTVFSKEHIYNAIIDVVDVNDDGKGVIKNVTKASDFKAYDALNERVEEAETKNILSGSFILFIKNLEIVKKTIKINLEVLACKLSAEKIVFLDESDEEQKPEKEQVEKPTETEQEIKQETESEEIPDFFV